MTWRIIVISGGEETMSRSLNLSASSMILTNALRSPFSALFRHTSAAATILGTSRVQQRHPAVEG